MAELLRSVGWVHVRDGRLLCVRTRGRDAFYLPGGKPEPGEAPEAALAREVWEELGLRLDPASLEPAGTFEGPAHGFDPPRPLRMECFRGVATGEPSPAGEVAEVAWLSAADAGRCAPVAGRILLHFAAAGEVRDAEPGAAPDERTE